MNAICGAVAVDAGRPVEALVRPMLAAMAVRGTHTPGVWVGPGAALACAANRAGQPTGGIAVRGPLVVAADTRFDNAAGLAATLGPGTPAETLAAACERWGDDAARHVRGDLALAAFDTRTRRLTLTRDRFGVRPLHYALLPDGTLVFASTLAGLLAVPGVERRLDEWQLASHLADLHDDPARTIYAGLLKVPHGAEVRVQNGRADVSTYYELGPEPGLDGRSVDDSVAGFRERFTEAVRVRLEGATRVGSQLSGGLDSTAVTVVAREQIPPALAPLHTYSLVYPDDSRADESPYIDAVVAQGGVVPHAMPGTAMEPLENLADLYAVLDDTVVSGNQHTLWMMFQAARADGVDVMLDGLDGDTTVDHGYGFFEELARAGDWGRFRDEAQALVWRHGTPDHTQPFEAAAESVDRLFATYGFPALAGFARRGRLVRAARGATGAHRTLGASPRILARELLRAALRRTPAPPLMPGAIGPLVEVLDAGFVARTDLRARLEARFRPGPVVSLRERQAELLMSTKMAQGLSGLNQIGASFGVETRHPFMDQKLIEYALALPPDLSLRAGWTRYVLREAIGPLMPPTIQTRIGKADLSSLLGRSFTGGDRERIDAALSRPRILQPRLDVGTLGRLRRQAEAADAGAHDDARMAATLLATASVWLDQKFTDSKRPERNRKARTGARRTGAEERAVVRSGWRTQGEPDLPCSRPRGAVDCF